MPTTTVVTTTAVSSTTTAVPSSTTTAAPSTSTAETPVVFNSTISEIDETIEARMSSSHRPGCPVALTALRYLEVTHWDFEGTSRLGELIVHQDHAEPLVGVFERLFTAGFAIQQMELVDQFDGDDDRSMAANNTSAYNCREVQWRPGVWSNHAFGAAIDINPLVNPYVKGTTVLPPEGAPFADRSEIGIGQISDGDVVVEAFTDIGWTWGGHWSNSKDYQHFDFR